MNTQFEKFNVKPFILEAVKELRFQKPTEVQERMIPSLLNGESAIGQSQTGTGKTHAYLIPILSKIDPSVQEVQAVITAPTRELANQIYQEVLKMTKFCAPEEEITARCYIGGTDKQRTIDRLKQQPQIVVGTPGRIKDLMSEKALQVYTAKTIVVDEADLMLEMGFIEDIDKIASAMPKDLQILVFSATIPEKLKPFLRKYMENPKYTHVAPKQVTAAKINHLLIPVKSKNKMKLLHDVLVQLNPFLAIVFTNTKKKADEVADSLLEQGLKVGRIHGDLNPRERKKMMKQINELDYQFVVATDLAARGIDIEGVSHVINFEIPTDLDFYVHRVGRTGRAEYSGKAITFYEPTDENALSQIEKLGITFTQMDLKGGELVEIGARNKRQNRQKKVNEIDVAAKTAVKKSEKVKPGYKKKHKYEVEQFKKRQRRLKKR
ncbi:ATP-dependent RNA helicase CshB [Bacillus tianshenii]|uniref:DEAD-box ATP-dependent RNA helicase CshB n=1 Tax=Sutcliffiella tianshenii TaxID=1463404 RepID=A0ABS2P084_9BACI|nr:DEAD/DEAH box helicase [Bacillus tianshenii]MBM7620286.1 ATP-dependent RNA helicase CshB [Bacillus tianshenii]